MENDATNPEIPGHEPDGTPITHEDLLQSLQEAEADIKTGRTYKGSELISHFEKLGENE